MGKLVRCEVIAEDDYRCNAVDYGPYKFNILAEGDSWFSVNGRRADNLLKSLQTPGPSIIVNHAYPGDPIKKISQLAKRSHLRKIFIDSADVFWDTLLLSGGGNDVIDDLKAIVRMPEPFTCVTNPANWVSEKELTSTLSRVADAFRAFSFYRKGTVHERLPILAHTYDYATPRNIARRFFGVRKGPWMYPVYKAIDAPLRMRPLITDYIFNRLADCLLDLEHGDDPIPDFHVCDTRGVLIPASADLSHRNIDWHDEIHPTRIGYEKLANARMNESLLAALEASPRSIREHSASTRISVHPDRGPHRI